MAISLTDEQVRRLRLRAQRLAPAPPAREVAQAIAAVGGLQAQDAAAADLAVRPRAAGLTADDVERARVEQRSVVTTWLMRGTLHLVATEDLGWLRPLLGPLFVAADRRRRAQLGLTDDRCALGIRLIRDRLAARGPQTRAELAEPLAAHGIPTAGQATIHLIYRAALEGVVCLGPARGRQATYVLLDDWVTLAPPLPRAAALAELARRYLAAFAPAGPADLAAWSGLPMRDVRSAWRQIADDLIEVVVVGRPAWLPKIRAAWLDGPPAAPPLRLLPRFDTYLLGYQNRDLAVASQHARRVHPGGGLLQAVVLVDGRAAGTWRSVRRRDGLEVVVEPFLPLPAPALTELEAEAADVGRFLGLTGVMRVQPSLA